MKNIRTLLLSATADTVFTLLLPAATVSGVILVALVLAGCVTSPATATSPPVMSQAPWVSTLTNSIAVVGQVSAPATNGLSELVAETINKLIIVGTGVGAALGTHRLAKSWHAAAPGQASASQPSPPNKV
jgi:uncharacterized membrane protein